MWAQRIRVRNCCLPRLLRTEPNRGIDRATVYLDLEMQMRTGRVTGGSNGADGLACRDRAAIQDESRREVAVEDAHVLIDGDEHEQAGPAGIESNMRSAAGRGIDRGSLWGGEIDAGVYVPAGTERIERLQVKGGAAERLRDHGAWNNRAERELLVTLDPRPGDDPYQHRRAANRANSQYAVHAWATMCSSPRSPVLRVDSNLCAMVS